MPNIISGLTFIPFVSSSKNLKRPALDAGNGAFYIESALKPGLHLITEKANVQPPDPRHATWRWDPTKKQKWFILPW